MLKNEPACNSRLKFRLDLEVVLARHERMNAALDLLESNPSSCRSSSLGCFAGAYHASDQGNRGRAGIERNIVLTDMPPDRFACPLAIDLISPSGPP